MKAKELPALAASNNRVLDGDTLGDIFVEERILISVLEESTYHITELIAGCCMKAQSIFRELDHGIICP